MSTAKVRVERVLVVNLDGLTLEDWGINPEYTMPHAVLIRLKQDVLMSFQSGLSREEALFAVQEKIGTYKGIHKPDRVIIASHPYPESLRDNATSIVNAVYDKLANLGWQN
jgi:hypothetical protein